MSERFDDFVSGLTQAAAATAAPGADAARRRARQRRSRQRLTASALSLVVLGGAGGIAAANLNHTGGPVPSAHSSTVASSAPVPGSPTPGSSASASPSAAASTSTAASNPDASPAVGTYHPGDWYDVTHVPLSSSTIAWVPFSSLLGSRIGGEVFQVAGSESIVTSLSSFGDRCGVGSLTTGTSAVQYEYYTGYDNNGSLNDADGAIAASVTHLVYIYPDSGAADAAWNGIASGFAACAKAETGANPSTGTELIGKATRTTSASGAQCWSNVTTPKSDPAADGTSDHVCLVRQGELIAAVDVKVNFNKSAYVSSVDYGTLDTTLRQGLVAGLSGELNSGDLPVCAGGDLKVTLGPSGTYRTSHGQYRVLVITNIGGSSCNLEGYPAVMLVDASGKIENTASDSMQDPNDAKAYSQARVTLAPNGTGSAILSWSSVADPGLCAYSGSYSLDVLAPASSTTTRLGTLSKVCDGLVITPIQPKVVTP